MAPTKKPEGSSSRCARRRSRAARALARGAGWRLPFASFGALVALAACGSNAAPAPGASASAGAGAPEGTTTSSPPEIAAGSDVVVEVARATFRAGNVLRTAGANVIVAYGRPDKETGKRTELTVLRDKLWPVSAGVTDAAEGEALVCRTGAEDVRPCRVTGKKPPRVACEDDWGKSYELEASALVRPDSGTQKIIAEHLDKQARMRAFDVAVKAAGKPARPKDWRPQKGDLVLAPFASASYYGARIKSLDGERATVDWEGSTWDDSQKATADLVPQPSDTPAQKPGSYALARPETATQRWDAVRLESADGDDAFDVVDREEGHRTVKLRDLVPLVP